MRTTSLLLLAALGLGAQAQAQPATELRLDLPLGQLTITQTPDQTAQVRNAATGHSVEVETAYLPTVMAQHDNSVLLEIYSGGNACPADYVWLSATPEALGLSKMFGTCAEGPEIIATEGYPRVVLDGFGEDIARHQYDFDGITVTETLLPPEGEGEPAPAPASWEGKSAYDLLRDPRMLPALQQILAPEQIDELRRAVELQLEDDAFRREGDWMIAGGCEPGAVDGRCGQVAVQLSSGRVTAGLETAGRVKTFGDGAAAVFGDYMVEPEEILGSWVVTAVNGVAVSELVDSDLDQPVVIFGAESTFSAQSFCNRLMGKAALGKRSLAITDLASTRMACPHAEAEVALLKVLDKAHRWVAIDQGLELRTPEGKSVLLVRGG